MKSYLRFTNFLVVLIFIFFPFYIGAKSIVITKDNVELTEKRLKSLDDEEEKVDLLLALGHYYFEKDKYNLVPVTKAVNYSNKAFVLSKKLKYTKGIGAFYVLHSLIEQYNKHYERTYSYAIAAINQLKGTKEFDLIGEAWVMVWSSKTLLGLKYEDRLFYLDKAISYFEKSGNKHRIADCYREKGDIYLLLGNGVESINCLKKSLSMYQQSKYKNLQYLYDLMGAAYIFLGDYKEGLKYCFMALNTTETIGDKKEFNYVIYNRIGMAYEEMTDYDNGLLYYQKSLQIAEKFKNTDDIKAIVGNISRTMLKTGHYDDALALITNIKKKYKTIGNGNSFKLDCITIRIFLHKKHYDKAVPYQKKLLSNISSVRDYDVLALIYTTLVDLNLALKNYEKAEFYNQLQYSICKKINKDSYFADFNLWEYKIDSARGNLKPALEHYKEYVRLSKKYFNEKRANEISKLNVLYETEKKDRYISNLNNKSTLQNASLEKASLTRNIMLGGFIILMAFVCFLYRAYRLKQRNNLILSTQQDQIKQTNISLNNAITEKEWLLREIHHRVKNNLHMVVGLLASQNEYLEGKEAIEANLESQRRVEAMSMIHNKLYQSENLTMIDMPSYILDLTYYLSDSFDVRKQIRFSLNIDKVDFPLSHSVPIGLILNEAVTNSIKYAFPNQEQGVITINLNKGNGKYHLTVRDDGVGIIEPVDIENSKSLGLKLIKGLSEDIRAEFNISNEGGTKIELIFTI